MLTPPRECGLRSECSIPQEILQTSLEIFLDATRGMRSSDVADYEPKYRSIVTNIINFYAAVSVETGQAEANKLNFIIILFLNVFMCCFLEH